ncbi:MAG TPA: hypothetical protein VIJ27_06425 [Mucilaginibacter sp.]
MKTNFSLLFYMKKQKKFKTKKVDRAFLSGEELQIMADKQFATQRLSQVRDVFLLCCYTRLAYSDVQRLKLSNNPAS